MPDTTALKTLIDEAYEQRAALSHDKVPAALARFAFGAFAPLAARRRG